MKLKTMLLGLITLAASFTSTAGMVQVSQGSNILGYINSYSGTETAVENWNNNDNPNSGPVGMAATIQFFFYENPTDGTTFNILFGGVDDNTTSSISLESSVDSDSDATVLVADDNGNEFSETGADVFTGNWSVFTCCTDGGVVGGLSGAWSVTVSISSFENVTSFLAQGTGSTIDFSMDPQSAITFTNMVNAPATVSLLLVGFMAIVYRRITK